MDQIKLTLTCACGNKGSRSQSTVLDKDNLKFTVETPYDTGTHDVVLGINIICNACGSRLDLLK